MDQIWTIKTYYYNLNTCSLTKPQSFLLSKFKQVNNVMTVRHQILLKTYR